MRRSSYECRIFFYLLTVLFASGLQAVRTATITSPIERATVTTNQPNVSGNVKDGGIPLPVYGVSLFINGVNITTTGTDANGIFNFTAADYGSTTLQNGSNTIVSSPLP